MVLPKVELRGAVSETMWLHVKPFRLPRSVSTILIGLIYHPPHASSEDNNALYSHVQETVDWFLRLYPEALVCVKGVLDSKACHTHRHKRNTNDIKNCYFVVVSLDLLN